MNNKRKISIPTILVIICITLTLVVIVWAIWQVSTRYTPVDVSNIISVDWSEIEECIEDTTTESIQPEISAESIQPEISAEFVVVHRSYRYSVDELSCVCLINAVESEVDDPVETDAITKLVDVVEYIDEDMYETPVYAVSDKRYVSIDSTDIIFTESDINMLASLVTLEVGAESYECQQAVASVVINRMIIDNKSLYDVIYQRNLFSVASRVKSTRPFDECIDAVLDVVQNGTTIPRYITYFRAGYYHDWGDRYISWRQIDKTYFTYDTKLKDKWG